MERDETRYRNTTDGAWLDDREDYYKALTESQYVRKRSRLVVILFLWWSDVLRANTGVARREFPTATKQTEALAKKLKASKLIFLSDVLGVMRDPEDNATLIPTLNEAAIVKLKAEGVISGGMIPKVDSALDALHGGVKKVHMIDGRIPHSLVLEIFTDRGIGTEITL